MMAAQQGRGTIKRAVVTGPTGVVGVNLINELLAHGVTVYAVCRPDSNRSINIPVHPLVRLVSCALDALESLPALIGTDCDAFYHLAWQGTHGAARDDTGLQSQNIAYTLAAVKAANELSCKAFVGAGSQAEFGPVSGKLAPETPCRPVTAYGAAKLESCLQSRAMCNSLGLRQNWCRILSLYGPYDGAHTMVMQLIAKLLQRERPACTKGDQIWDYLYAKDAARAFLLVGERGADSAVYCLGSGQTRPLCDYIRAIRDAVDPTLPIGFGELAYYPNQAMHLEADISALQRDTGFLPQYTFEEGVRETVAFVRETLLAGGTLR